MFLLTMLLVIGLMYLHTGVISMQKMTLHVYISYTFAVVIVFIKDVTYVRGCDCIQ